MNPIAIAEYVSAAFVGIILLTQFDKQNKTLSNKWLNASLLTLFIYLIVDASAYIFTGPEISYALKYILNLLAFSMGGIVIIFFTKFTEAYIRERTALDSWVLRIPIIILAVNCVLIVINFIAGKLVVFDSAGMITAVNDYPIYLRIIQIIPMVYTPIVVISKRKSIGLKAVMLLGFYSLAPVFASILAVFIGVDIGVIFGAVILMLVAMVLAKDERQQFLENINAELNGALENSKIETQRNDSLYEIAKAFKWSYGIDADGKLVSAYYGQSARAHVAEGINKNPMSWLDILHPDDKERVYGEFMAAVNDRSGKTPYETTYRIELAEGEYGWVRTSGRVIRHEDGTAELFGMSVNITSEIEEQQKRLSEKNEIERLRLKEVELKHTEFRASALAYLVENEVNITAFLDFFAEKLRDLVKCDQVIYRDDEGHRYIKNAPELGDGYRIAAETCLNCPHSDMHSPLYASGVTEMEDTAIGVDGVPVNKACPVKSALTRTVHLDGNVCGYLAIHYILDYHEFSEYERRTLEEFTNLLSLLLSRYAARTKNKKLEEELDLKKTVEQQKIQLERQQAQLEDALAMAEHANKAKTDFLFNMSHDIRTPMNAIVGFTNIAKREITNTEKALDSIKKVQLSSDILLNLINDVLDMSRIESGKAELHEEKHDVMGAFDNIEPAMANLAASKDIDLKFNVGEVRDRYVFADGPRFDRILINIVSNAIKYTMSGGFVKVSVNQLEDTKEGYGNYRFVVSDSGIGMSEEFQQHMFEDFAREENSKTSGIQGTGLGLGLAKRLVDMMGGTISCISKEGIGTTFTIDFPFRLQTDEDRAEDNDAVQEYVNIDLSGKRALLVEDNELNREIADEILSDEGITVEMAVDGQNAVNKIRERGDGYYDFILMDIQMPVMDGYEATRTIRKLMPDFKTPIIALSANAFAEDKQKSIEAGMNDHVAKPIDIKELKMTLARFAK